MRKIIIAAALLITANTALSDEFEGWVEPVMQDYVYQQQQLTNQRRLIEIQNRQLQIQERQYQLQNQQQYEPKLLLFCVHFLILCWPSQFFFFNCNLFSLPADGAVDESVN